MAIAYLAHRPDLAWLPGVVVPDPEVLQASQALPSSHDETVNSSPLKGYPGKRSDVGLLLLSSQDELNLGLAAGLVLGASQHWGNILINLN